MRENSTAANTTKGIKLIFNKLWMSYSLKFVIIIPIIIQLSNNSYDS